MQLLFKPIRQEASVKSFQLLDWRSASGLPYDEFLTEQDALTEKRLSGGIPDTVILANHPPTITLGARALREQLAAIRVLPREILAGADEAALLGVAEEYLRNRFGIDLVRTRRGGSVWYHDTGVLDLYVVAETSPRFPAETIHLLEETLYRGLLACGIPVRRVPERNESGKQQYLGIWSGEKKLAALGVRVVARGGRFVSTFGAALNVSPDPTHLRLIDPCGIAGRDATSITAIAPHQLPTERTLVRALTAAFGDVFGATLTEEKK